MLSPTLRRGLDEFSIGAKLRDLRQRKRMKLVELGQHTGLSAAMLSKIERSRLYPTLPTLLRIALVFEVGLEYFFLDARQRPIVGVVRRRERLRFPEKPGAKEPAFQFESLDFAAVERRSSAYFAEFFQVSPNRVRLHQHPGGEFVFVLRGTLVLRINEDEHVLEAEDAIYFDSSAPHGYRRKGARSCAAIVVTL